MDDEKLFEAVARSICMERGAPACDCRKTGICRAPLETLSEHNWIGDQARAAIRVCRAAVIEECARVVEGTPIYSSGSVEGIEKAVATSIRALAKEGGE